MEILVKNVMKTADGIKLFLAIFERKRTYYGLYMYHFLCLWHVSVKSNDKWCNFALPTEKRALKSPTKNELNAV